MAFQQEAHAKKKKKIITLLASFDCRHIRSLLISNLLIFFRLERERLSEKLRQKEVLERELNRERASLQEQLIKQAKLNEIIRQKDLFEKELRKEKNELQVCNQELSSFVQLLTVTLHLFLLSSYVRSTISRENRGSVSGLNFKC